MLDSTKTAPTARNNGTQPQQSHTPTDSDAHDGAASGTSNGYPEEWFAAQYQGELSPHHRTQLEIESAITAESIAARKPFTVYDPALLVKLGYSVAQSKAASKDEPVLVLPTYDRLGRRRDIVMRPDNPLTDKNGKRPKYVLRFGALPHLDFSPLTVHKIDDPNEIAIYSEGAKKVDSAASRGAFAVNINGLYGFRGANAKGGITNLADWDEIAHEGKKTNGERFGRLSLLVPDSDVSTNPKLEGAFERLHALLTARGAAVQVVYFEPGPDGKKTGLDDFFARGGNVEKLLSMARPKKTKEESRRERKEARDKARLVELEKTGLPNIETGNQQLETQIKAISQALGDANKRDPHLFHSPQGLSRISFDKNGRAVIIPASVEIVQDAAAKAANWIHTSEREGITNTSPPRNLCSVFAQTPHNWVSIPPIDNVVTAPFFAPNGTLCATHGYHAAAGTYLDLPKGFQLPDTSPTPENLKTSIDLIVDFLLKEVAFADDASCAHAIAQMLLPLVRRMINDCTPIHLWDGPVQSSGKSYGAEICIEVYEEPHSMDDIADEAEWSKSIFSSILEGRTFQFFDNIKGRLSSSSLASYVSSRSKSGRILGTNRTGTVSTLGTVWVATSNNAQLDGDARSRALLIRLDTGLEQPEDKQYTSDPKAFIKENQEMILGALVTIVRHWQEQGSPLYEGGKSRFKEWSRVIGGILNAAGIAGFLQNVDEAREDFAPEIDAWKEFVSAWWITYGDRGVTAKELLNTVVMTTTPRFGNQAPVVEVRCEGIREMLPRDEIEQARSLGNLLIARRDQIFIQYKISRDPKKTQFGVKWRLIPQFDPKKQPETPKNSQKHDTSDTSDTSHTQAEETRLFRDLEKSENESQEKRVNTEGVETASEVSEVSCFAAESEDRERGEI